MVFDFLICSERSGSNLITKIMNAHPDICGPSPSHIMETFSTNLFKYGDIKKDENWNVLVKDVSDMMNNSLGVWKCTFNEKMIKDGVKSRSLSDIYRFIYESEARLHNKNRVFVKNNHIYNYLAHITAYFTDSKFVYMTRDPRDMALVWREAASAAGGIKEGSRKWKVDQSESIKAYGYLKDLGRIHLLRFEDLLSNTEEELIKICDFLGVKYTPQMLEFYKLDHVIENSNRLPSWKDTKCPIIKDNFARYKTELNEMEIRFIESLCSEEMDFLGYEKEFEVCESPEEIEKKMPPEDLSHKVLTDMEVKIYTKFNAVRSGINNKKVSKCEFLE